MAKKTNEKKETEKKAFKIITSDDVKNKEGI